jgi:SAM-dependent methyltransferase
MQHAVRKDPLARLFPEKRVVSFIHRQDRIVFFSMVNELIGPESVVLDYGAGRGRQAEVGGPHLRQISCFRGRCARLIGIDVDPVVLENPVIDEAHVVGLEDRLPLPDESVDVVYSYATFEHVDDPEWVAGELGRVVRPGGWICAWTPNKWGYVGIGARLVPNDLHARVLRYVAPGGRAEKDIFPTRYRMNTLRDVGRLFPKERFRNFSFGFNAQPSYNFGSPLVARLWLLYMALTPRAMAQSLFVFVQKK